MEFIHNSFSMLQFKEFNPDKHLTDSEKQILNRARVTTVKNQDIYATIKESTARIAQQFAITHEPTKQSQHNQKTLIELELEKKQIEEDKKTLYNKYYNNFIEMMIPKEEGLPAQQVEIKWIKISNKSGEVLYFNKETGEISDKLPDEIKALNSQSEDNWYWLRNEAHVWIPGHLLEDSNNKCTFITPGGEKITLPSTSLLTSIKFNKRLLIAVFNDLLTCEERNEPFILYNITNRYYKDNIYTMLGDILISVNPYKPLPIYTSEYITKYLNDPKHLLSPHIYQIAEKAIANIMMTSKSQAIFITGESGSGKTEAMKLLMKFINHKCEFGDAVLERKYQLSTPLIEAFGNSKTTENDNSSRFCKWIEIEVESNQVGVGKIKTCNIICFLLEKSRVAIQNLGERK